MIDFLGKDEIYSTNVCNALKVIKRESIFLSQVFVNMKSYVVTTSSITSLDSYFTPHSIPLACMKSFKPLFQHEHYVSSKKNPCPCLVPFESIHLFPPKTFA